LSEQDGKHVVVDWQFVNHKLLDNAYEHVKVTARFIFKVT